MMISMFLITDLLKLIGWCWFGWTNQSTDLYRLDLPDIEAIKVFRSDQTYKYISITKETTAREAVRSALLEFGFSEVESQNESRFSLCRVTCLDVNFVKQTRLPDPLSDLTSKLTLSDRYYLKDLTETAPLGKISRELVF